MRQPREAGILMIILTVEDQAPTPAHAPEPGVPVGVVPGFVVVPEPGLFILLRTLSHLLLVYLRAGR